MTNGVLCFNLSDGFVPHVLLCRPKFVARPFWLHDASVLKVDVLTIGKAGKAVVDVNIKLFHATELQDT